MDLTDNEKRDAVKLIEAGKPLPDKYRFLLFDDDREVELVWNGKTAEVTNVVLPFQAIEQVDEPRSEDTREEVINRRPCSMSMIGEGSLRAGPIPSPKSRAFWRNWHIATHGARWWTSSATTR